MSAYFSATAREVATMAKQTSALLRADLKSLNTALTTAGTLSNGGNGTPAEHLAHDALLGILERFAVVQNQIANLTAVILEGE
jgi:hypothetical protein